MFLENVLRHPGGWHPGSETLLVWIAPRCRILFTEICGCKRQNRQLATLAMLSIRLVGFDLWGEEEQRVASRLNNDRFTRSRVVDLFVWHTVPEDSGEPDLVKIVNSAVSAVRIRGIWAPGRTSGDMGVRSSIPAIHSLTSRESRRRLWHIAPGLLAFPLQLVSHADPLSNTLRWIILAVIGALSAHVYLRFRRIQRNAQDKGLSAVIGYALAVLLTIVAFPDRLEVGLGVLSILAFGDGSATAFGKMLRGPSLPWNRAKSWAGFLAFLICGSLMTTWIYWGETQNPEAQEPALSLFRAFCLTSPAVAVCAVVESLNLRINDNIRVGVAGSVLLTLLSFLR